MNIKNIAVFCPFGVFPIVQEISQTYPSLIELSSSSPQRQRQLAALSVVDLFKNAINRVENSFQFIAYPNLGPHDFFKSDEAVNILYRNFENASLLIARGQELATELKGRPWINEQRANLAKVYFEQGDTTIAAGFTPFAETIKSLSSQLSFIAYGLGFVMVVPAMCLGASTLALSIAASRLEAGTRLGVYGRTRKAQLTSEEAAALLNGFADRQVKRTLQELKEWPNVSKLALENFGFLLSALEDLSKTLEFLDYRLTTFDLSDSRSFMSSPLDASDPSSSEAYSKFIEDRSRFGSNGFPTFSEYFEASSRTLELAVSSRCIHELQNALSYNSSDIQTLNEGYRPDFFAKLIEADTQFTTRDQQLDHFFREFLVPLMFDLRHHNLFEIRTDEDAYNRAKLILERSGKFRRLHVTSDFATQQAERSSKFQRPSPFALK